MKREKKKLSWNSRKRKCFEIFKLFAAASVLRLMKGLGISDMKPSGSISRQLC